MSKKAVLIAATPDGIPRLPSARTTVMVAVLDPVTPDEVAAIADAVASSGAGYLFSWGFSSSELHDATDTAHIRIRGAYADNHEFIMTSGAGSYNWRQAHFYYRKCATRCCGTVLRPVILAVSRDAAKAVRFLVSKGLLRRASERTLVRVGGALVRQAGEGPLAVRGADASGGRHPSWLN